MFAFANCHYEDERISYEEWVNKKNQTPFGKLPVLNASGIEICQSKTINRYLAKKLNLFGKDCKESLLIDMICECFYDLITPLEKFESIDANEIEERKKIYREKELPELLTKLEKLAKKYGSKGHFVGNQVRIFFPYILFNREKNMNKNVLKNNLLYLIKKRTETKVFKSMFLFINNRCRWQT